jgi:hypothetical protein
VKKRVGVEDFLNIPLGSGRSFSFRLGEAGRAAIGSRRGLRRACAAALVALCLGPFGLADTAVDVGQRTAARLFGG